MTEVRNRHGEVVGTVEGGTYFTRRDMRLGQIFILAKYGNAMGLDVPIIEQLRKAGVFCVAIRVVGFEFDNFWAVAHLEDFVKKGKLVNFNRKGSKGEDLTGWDEQFILPMACFTRAVDQKQFESACWDVAFAEDALHA